MPIPIGVDAASQPVVYDPIGDGHLAVNGAVGTGKTQAFRTIAASVVDQGGMLYAFDVSDRGLGLGVLRGATGVASGLDTAVDLMAEIAAETQFHAELMGAHRVSALLSIPESVRPQPIIVVIDDAEHLLGRLDPTERLKPIHRAIADSLQSILFASYAVDVRVVVGVNPSPTPRPHLQPMLRFGANLDLGPMRRGDRIARGLPADPDPAWSLPRTPGEGLYRAGPGAHPVHVRCTMLPTDNQAGTGN